jgi:soluble lytic murein transglycosylase-like protein
MPKRLWLATLLIPAAAAAALKEPPLSDKSWSKKYDHHFRKYAKHYFGPNVDWRWFKAQGIAESNLKPHARSSTGAVGIMQILPSTYKEIKHSNPQLLSITTPRSNIAAGIYYDRQMYRRWKDKGLSRDERLAFAFGSYNAGYGGVSKAYKKASEVHPKIDTWEQVSSFSPKETRRYVSRIRGLMKGAK